MTKAESEVRQDKGSSRLGTYMLQGWVLTDEPCPVPGCNIPLVRSKDRARKLCVLCDDPEHPHPPPSAKPESNVETTSVVNEITEEEEEELANILAEEDRTTPSNQVGETQDQEFARIRREQGNKASRLLGQKMLAGWTLLDENCPNGTCYGVPLVRNRQKQNYCVICERSYVDGQEVVRNPPNSPPAPQPSAAKELTNEPGPSTPVSRLEEGRPSPIPVPEKTPRSDEEREDVSKRRKLTTRPENIPRSGVASATGAAEQAALTIVALSKRLEDLRGILEGVTNPDESRVLCDAITSCANAIVACQAIKKF
ncbi:uncharacterized protein SPPG_06602 [Spizellomyces punctatus DAOM BR117]|uniref:Uncharacterized protein n=1 Tax=Spizellomyces punctatus (strain DAOM BR117) TaxID=645134 RepID=A0A0L0H9H6_SPIPD|nr:uncharacterized protein SPPG_06602 [Spizellomyces punctatus DAOM BR117]KNC98200.1 hypothetical protein SPPG_06602 [Spizellomyces punctatus DAOM BR117]|eukprot:XP_016606240.1 hypothetical protein SPPG_06602 [Spizellomyces punctatus DAOM BR117]